MLINTPVTRLPSIPYPILPAPMHPVAYARLTKGVSEAHVDETKATWEYLDNGARRFKPVTLDPGATTAPGDARMHRLKFWRGYGEGEVIHTHACPPYALLGR